ncbi:MAG: AAA family ATPase [Desulfobacteraceae bacterium]|nr:AAA family ATPase [Desulfobacteraceae bacterium]
MKCPRCQDENPEGRKFCRECGAKLSVICRICSFENLPGDKFCGGCGKKLAQAVEKEGVPETEGERKYVTVLFSDLSGFTSLSEKLDPEDVKEVMSRIFGDVAQIVSNYEGFIEKYIGDAIMAIFGAPKTHEDDPIRAVRAAMEINDLVSSISPEIEEMIGKPVTMHTGINTGLVVMGNVKMEKGTHGVLGDAVNLAARLMNVAMPGEIVIGHSTCRQVEDVFSLEKMAPVRVKGKADPVQPYRVMGLKSEFQPVKRVSRERVMSPIIGRDAELSVLYYCLERLLGGKGSIVTVRGEAGIGKSRLIEESYRNAKKDKKLGQVEWLQGNTLSYGQTISYWPFLEIFRACSGITEEDDETVAWEKLETKIIHMFGNGADEILPYIASLMNLEPKAEYGERTRYLDGDAMGRQIFLASYRFFDALSKSEPVVLIFEDLQWMDGSSAALLEHIMPLVKKRPILILGLYRPDPDTAADRFRQVIDERYRDAYQEIRLAPLRNSDSQNLVRNLLRTGHSSIQGWEAVIEKSEGNPFFLEEVIRSFIDNGAIKIDPETGQWKATGKIEASTIPDTVQGLIIARIDRLDQEAKRALRSASVIGRKFLYRVLSAIEAFESGLDKALEALQSTEIIREKKNIPELEYIFTHALVQQATYESILLRKRRSLHGDVGRAIETMFRDRLEEFYGLLAYHFAKAEEWEKAHQYLMKAGDQAGKIAADAEALVHYQQALSAYERAFGDNWEPLQRVSLERKIGEALYRRGEMRPALEYLHRSLELLEKPMKTTRWPVRFGIAGAIWRHILHNMLQWVHPKPAPDNISPEVEEEDRIYVPLAWIYGYLDPEKFMYTVLRRLNASERSQYPYGIATVSTGMGFICDFLSLPAFARRYHSRSVSESEKLKNPEALGLACFGMAFYEQLQGNWGMAIDQGQRGADAYRLAGDLRGWAECVTYGIIFPLISRGETKRSGKYSEELIRLGNEGDDATILTRGLYVQGLVHMRMGRYEEALPFLKKALKLAESIPDYIGSSQIGALLGQCYLYGEDLQKALEILEESEQKNTEHRIPTVLTNLMHNLSEVYLMFAEKERDNKADWMRKAARACKLALRAGKGAKARLPEAMLLQGRYLWIKGRAKAAKKMWLRGEEMAEEMEMPYERGMIHREIGTRMNDQAYLESAEAIFRKIAEDV